MPTGAVGSGVHTAALTSVVDSSEKPVTERGQEILAAPARNWILSTGAFGVVFASLTTTVNAFGEMC